MDDLSTYEKNQIIDKQLKKNKQNLLMELDASEFMLLKYVKQKIVNVPCYRKDIPLGLPVFLSNRDYNDVVHNYQGYEVKW